MDLTTAQRYADKLSAWLYPHCTHIAIAGSVRRRRPIVNDIDIVAIAKVFEQKDMLGQVIERTNDCLSFLQNYVHSGGDRRGGERPRFISGGEKEGKQLVLQLPKCQLDLWF